MSDEIIIETETPKRRGRPTDPMTEHLQRHRRAKAKHAKLAAKWQKVSTLEQELKEAETELHEAVQALRNALGEI